MAAQPGNDLAKFCSSSKPFEVLVFSANPNSDGQRHARRKLSAAERAKVHAVRRSGACLTCRMFKVPCNPPDPEKPGPCKMCLTVRSRSQQRGLLAFRECIRTSISTINIFRNSLGVEFTSLDAPKLRSLLAKTILSERVAPSRLESMVSNVFTWILNNKALDQSVVGMLCSGRFSELSRPLVDGELAAKFRVLLYSSSLAYVYDSRATYDSDLTIDDLRRITYAMGSDLLQDIDKMLSPHMLAKFSQEQLRVLFLALFGVTLAIAYSAAIEDSPSFPSIPELYDGNIPKTLWEAMQQHLVQIMAHYLVLLASRLGLVLPGGSERDALSSLMTGLTQRGVFIWVADVIPIVPSTPVNTDVDDKLFLLSNPESIGSDPTTKLEEKHLESYRSRQLNAGGLRAVQNSLRAVSPQLGYLQRRYNSVSHAKIAPVYSEAEIVPLLFQGQFGDPSDSASAEGESVGHKRFSTVGGTGSLSYIGPIKKRRVI
ncbi:hypothetical protein DL765_001573 [Monosporascus sp. GIB2]|nr:hypothetical protein DL765_001573 [Monosporascus sp. GIB2]